MVEQNLSTVDAKTPLTNIWANLAGSGEQVLKGASGVIDNTWGVIGTENGFISNGGPVKGKKYVIGADDFSTVYDWTCYSAEVVEMKFGFTNQADADQNMLPTVDNNSEKQIGREAC